MAIGLLVSGTAAADIIQQFTTGDLVVSVEGDGSGTGSYTDNQAAPLTLFQYSLNGAAPASFAGSLELPQVASGNNLPVSGEYGSSSEGTLQLSGNGQYLTIMGYGVSAAMFNANPAQYGASPSNALGQSGSLTGQSYTPVARVVALIDANGNVNSSTAVYNVFNTNNPRSAYTLTGANGTGVYISGQGTGSDATGGVFLTTIGSTNNSPTAITGLDSTSNSTSQDTRDVQIYNGQLYVSTDTKEGSGSARSFVGTLGAAGTPPTSLANSGNGPTQLPTFGSSKTGQETLTANNDNSVNSSAVGKTINLSPESYFFANATTLYVADSGDTKQNSAQSSLGDGGLQKWTFNGTGWVLDYTLSAGLGLVTNSSSDGTSGLFGLTGQVEADGTVELFATNYTLSDLDQTYLFGITDTLSDMTATQASGETFATLATAPADSNFKGVSFAPTAASTPEPASFALIFLGMTALFVTRHRKAN